MVRYVGNFFNEKEDQTEVNVSPSKSGLTADVGLLACLSLRRLAQGQIGIPV